MLEAATDAVGDRSSLEVSAGPKRRALVVALHDVAPPFEREIRRQLDALAGLGVTRCVLMVVPNWHGRNPLGESGSFVEMVRSASDAGCQIVLHGAEHRTRGEVRGPPPLRARAALFAPGVAEYLTLDPEGAYRATLEGIGALTSAGLPPSDTFCAPGWLLRPDARPALAAAGVHTVAGMLSARRLDSGRVMALPSFGYMGGSAAQEAGIRLLNGIVLRAAGGRAGAACAYLHPQGAPGSRSMQSVFASIGRMVRDGWIPSTYADLYGKDG